MQYVSCNDTIKHTAQCENQKHEHCGTSSLAWQHLMRSTAVQLSLCLIQHHAMKPYGGGGSMGPHIHLGTRQTKCGCLTAPATSPQEPHELEAGRTSEAPSMLWTPQKFFPCQNLNHNFLVMQPTAQMLQWLTYPISLQVLLPNVQHSPSWIANSGSLSQKISHSFGSIH